jgi:hypothetical protein
MDYLEGNVAKLPEDQIGQRKFRKIVLEEAIRRHRNRGHENGLGHYTNESGTKKVTRELSGYCVMKVEEKHTGEVLYSRYYYMETQSHAIDFTTVYTRWKGFNMRATFF